MNTLTELTRQESIVLALIAQGKRNAQIARELFLSVRTVETHVYRIFQKLELSSRTEAALYALRSGLLLMPEYSDSTQEPEGSHTGSQIIR